LDPERIINWIKTAVGIVDFVRNVSNTSFQCLISIHTHHETWEKLGDGLDDKKEAEMGPILAEGNFTVIDLLRYMELWGPLEYYQSRWYKHNKKEKDFLGWCTLASGGVVRIDRLPTLLTVWDYKTQSLSELDFKKKERLRKVWENLTRASEAEASARKPRFVFDADHPAFPSHATDAIIECAPFCWE
jgi:hypothetical protein